MTADGGRGDIFLLDYRIPSLIMPSIRARRDVLVRFSRRSGKCAALKRRALWRGLLRFIAGRPSSLGSHGCIAGWVECSNIDQKRWTADTVLREQLGLAIALIHCRSNATIGNQSEFALLKPNMFRDRTAGSGVEL